MRAFMITVCVGLASVCLCPLLWLRRACRALRTERAENQQLRKIIWLWRLESDEQNQKLEKLRRARHDLRHYLCAACREPTESLRALKAELEQELVSSSGDWAFSALVDYYCSQATRLGVRTDCKLDFRNVPGSYAADVYLIVSNLLGNALEALGREGGGWLRARSLASSGWFSLVIGNSRSQPLRRKNGRYLSSKAPGRYGIGLETVRQAAERYGGKVRFTADGKEFHASVFLPCPSVPGPGESTRQVLFGGRKRGWRADCPSDAALAVV